jgi:glyceraldehyde 3-phosphate dehydrogenase
MALRVALNGCGRIGRNIIRSWLQNNRHQQNIEIVAINDLASADILAHLLQYDSVFGQLSSKVQVDSGHLLIDGRHAIHLTQCRDPADCPWGEKNVDIVFECTGLFASKQKASAHLKAGAKQVVISAPAGEDIDATIVYGVNH